MSDIIGDLLPRDKFQEPPEARIIRDFVMARFQEAPQVAVRQTQIVIQVKSAALAGALRMHLYELGELCQTDKRLVVRIGS